MTISYQWHSLTNDLQLKELELVGKKVDENFFRSRDEAIEWLKKEKEADELFEDGSALVLIELFFT